MLRNCMKKLAVIITGFIVVASSEANEPKIEEDKLKPILVQSDPVIVDHFMVSLSEQFRVFTNGDMEFKCGTGGMYSTFTKYGHINSKIFFSSKIEALRRLKAGEVISCEKAQDVVNSQPQQHASHDKLDAVQRAELVPRYYEELQNVLHETVCYELATHLAFDSPSAEKYVDHWEQVNQNLDEYIVETYIGIREDGMTAWQVSDLEKLLMEKYFGTDLSLVKVSERNDIRAKFLIDNCSIY